MALTLWLALAVIITRPDVPDAAYRELALRPEFGSAGRVVIGEGGGSGVLIGGRYFLTAAHVVRDRPVDAMRVLVGGVEHRASRVHLPPPSVVGSPPLTRTAGDIGIIELAEASVVTPARLASRPAVVGEIATIVGYGVGGQGATSNAGIRRAARNVIDQVGGVWRGSVVPDNLLFVDFDGVGPAYKNMLGAAEPDPLEGLASGGDSGGGVFVRRDDQWFVIGTFSVSIVDIGAAASRTFSGGVNVFVGLEPHLTWIRSVIGD